MTFDLGTCTPLSIVNEELSAQGTCVESPVEEQGSYSTDTGNKDVEPFGTCTEEVVPIILVNVESDSQGTCCADSGRSHSIDTSNSSIYWYICINIEPFVDLGRCTPNSSVIEELSTSCSQQLLADGQGMWYQWSILGTPKPIAGA